jgi:5-deoxy-glucuronate isomerase
MWYLWVIRHLDGDRYRQPIFVDEHRWVQEADADIWALPSERGGPGGRR